MPNQRSDHQGPHRVQFEKNKRKILATQDVCGICGRHVDKSIKYPHPMSPTIDHIIPIIRGGHPSDIDNLQLTHMTCNRQKADKLIDRTVLNDTQSTISNRILPLTMDWRAYRSS